MAESDDAELRLGADLAQRVREEAERRSVSAEEFVAGAIEAGLAAPRGLPLHARVFRTIGVVIGVTAAAALVVALVALAWWQLSPAEAQPTPPTARGQRGHVVGLLPRSFSKWDEYFVVQTPLQVEGVSLKENRSIHIDRATMVGLFGGRLRVPLWLLNRTVSAKSRLFGGASNEGARVLVQVRGSERNKRLWAVLIEPSGAVPVAEQRLEWMTPDSDGVYHLTAVSQGWGYSDGSPIEMDTELQGDPAPGRTGYAVDAIVGEEVRVMSRGATETIRLGRPTSQKDYDAFASAIDSAGMRFSFGAKREGRHLRIVSIAPAL